jgi:hypothetical protein
LAIGGDGSDQLLILEVILLSLRVGIVVLFPQAILLQECKDEIAIIVVEFFCPLRPVGWIKLHPLQLVAVTVCANFAPFFVGNFL